MKTWSVSSIRSFHQCQLAWWFKRQGAEEEFRPVALLEGIVLHAALAFHLKTQQTAAVPTEQEAVEVLEASWFTELCGSNAPVRYGRLDEGQMLSRLRGLYRHWRANFTLPGDIVAVEEQIEVSLPGLELPLLGYVDLVLRTPGGDQVIDFKTSASRPSPDELLDPLDLQKLSMTRGWEASRGHRVGAWQWCYLVKTKEPQLVPVNEPVTEARADDDLRRLARVVNPTVAAMADVLDGTRAPVPTQSYSAMCEGCPYRTRCSRGAW